MNALVFVHGLSGSGRWWRPVLPFFEDRDVRVVDLPRFGMVQGFGPHDAAGWLGDWLDREGLAGADVAGHSLGGPIAAELAVQRPEAVRRLVLVMPAGVPTGRGVTGHVLPLLVVLPEAGHVPMFDAPAELAGHIRTFLLAPPSPVELCGSEPLSREL